VPIMLIALYAALKIQFRQRRYVAWSYWLVVVMVAVFGTTAADALHVVLGIPYIYSTTFYAIVLTVIFVSWYRSKKTLSIHSIYSRRREQFYWATVLATFALGTAAGDLTATPLHLGFLVSGLMFLGVFVVPAVGYWLFGLNEIFAFWFAYIITRPLGASFSDWMAVTGKRGGLNIGPGTVSLILGLLILAFVSYLSIRRNDDGNKLAPARKPRRGEHAHEHSYATLEPVRDEI